MSEITKIVTTSTPCQSQPCGKQTRAPNTTPRVSMIVTRSGDTPSLISSRAIGPRTAWDKRRNRSSISRAARPSPQALGSPRSGEQLRQRLGVADDRHEVRVAGPARHHVLVQVRGDAGTGDRALVHARG